MKIFGIGVDIVDNKRISNSIKNKGFVLRVFSKKEIDNSKKITNKTNFFAKRFAAKESLSKALGTGFRKGINFKDIEVLNDVLGKPFIKLKGSTANFLYNKINRKKYLIHLSLSDDKPWAQATVIISYK